MIDADLPPAIVGRASVVDGDTLEVRGQRIRLWGVDAPEGRQTCERQGQSYRCGQNAANALDAWIAGRPVVCIPEGPADRYRRIVARCTVSGSDIGGWIVGQGWAVDYPRYSNGTYERLQHDAQVRRRGLWAGSFQMPWDWRAARRPR